MAIKTQRPALPPLPHTVARPAPPPAKPDYGAQFLLLDLTDSPAHKLRTAASSLIRQAPQAKMHIKQPDLAESHVSLMTLAAPAMPRAPASQEQPARGAREGLTALSTAAPARLSLLPEVNYLNAPRVGPPAFTVAYLKVSDPSGDIGRLRQTFGDASGLQSVSHAPMHLTLGNLQLGSRLPQHVEDQVGRLARGLGSWEQGDVVLSGRHGWEMGRLSLN